MHHLPDLPKAAAWTIASVYSFGYFILIDAQGKAQAEAVLTHIA